MAVFFSGVFNPNVYFTEGAAPAETPRPPRPADNERRIYKPTGLIDRPRTVQERVEQTAEIAREIEAEREERQAPVPQPYYPPVSLMSQRDIDMELGARLREIARQQEEDEDFLMLMMMVV